MGNYNNPPKVEKAEAIFDWAANLLHATRKAKAQWDKLQAKAKTLNAANGFKTDEEE
jgi:hypothetical protein